jgi:aspartate-semialdehyde dehydrogenase
MASKVIRAAIVGASTLLGKELLNEVSDSPASAWDLRLLEEGDESEGQLTSVGDEALVMHSLNDEAFTGLDLVLFAGPASQTQTFLPAALQAGAAVVDLSGATGNRPDFLLRSPWVNGSQRPDLTTAGVRTPHPAALVLAILTSRLQSRFEGVQVRATVLEPASEAGAAGVDELHQQTVSLLSFQDVPKAVFGGQVAFNVQPRLGEDAAVSLQAIGQRVRTEALALLGNGRGEALSLQVLQAPVFHGSVVSAYLELATASDAGAVRTALRGGIVTADEDTVPSNQSATEAGDLLVSVESDEAKPEGFWLTAAADNLRLAGRNAVQAALELLSLRPGTPVQ